MKTLFKIMLTEAAMSIVARCLTVALASMLASGGSASFAQTRERAVARGAMPDHGVIMGNDPVAPIMARSVAPVSCVSPLTLNSTGDGCVSTAVASCSGGRVLSGSGASSACYCPATFPIWNSGPRVCENPGQPYIAAVAGQPYIAPVAGQPYIAAVAGQPYIAPVTGQSAIAAVTGQPAIAAVAGQSYIAAVAGQSYIAAVAGRPYIAAVAAVNAYYDNLGQPYIAPSGYHAAVTARAAYYDNPGRPYIAPSGYHAAVAAANAYYDNPGRPYIAPSGYHPAITAVADLI